jgi:hypothetical protein
MNPDPVAADEWLSRYILYSNHIRNSNNTIKPNAFMPHPHQDLSVTRHLDLEQEAIWSLGEDVARERGKQLYGRAVNQASTYIEQKLKVLPDPLFGNPNHANVTGWPDKEAQKIIAMEIAAKSEYIPRQ